MESVHRCTDRPVTPPPRRAAVLDTMAFSAVFHEADRWIATTSMRLDLPLVSTDRVFQEVRGLTVLKPRPAG